MTKMNEQFPIGNQSMSAVVLSSVSLGALIRQQRKLLKLTQADLAGIGNTGNRFIVDLENGKPTVQLQKVLDVMDLLGLDMVVQRKTPGAR